MSYPVLSSPSFPPFPLPCFFPLGPDSEIPMIFIQAFPPPPIPYILVQFWVAWSMKQNKTAAGCQTGRRRATRRHSICSHRDLSTNAKFSHLKWPPTLSTKIINAGLLGFCFPFFVAVTARRSHLYALQASSVPEIGKDMLAQSTVSLRMQCAVVQKIILYISRSICDCGRMIK